MEKDKIQEAMVSDAVTEKPISFIITYSEAKEVRVSHIFQLGKKVFSRPITKTVENTVKRDFTVYPPTLGKMQILSKYYLLLDIDEQKLSEEPHLEAMRVCESKTDVVCALMAVSVLHNKEDLLNDNKVNELIDFFKWHCKPQDFSTIMLAILTQVDYANFMSSIRLTKLLRQNKPKQEERASRVE